MRQTGFRLEGYRYWILCAAMLLCPFPVLAVEGSGFGFAGELGVGYDDNVSNWLANRAKRESGLVNAAVQVGNALALSRNTILQLRGSLRVEAVTDYEALNYAKLIGSVRLVHRPEGGFYAPTMALTASAAQWEFNSSIRDSSEYQVGLLLMQPISTLISGRLSIAGTQRESASRVFDLANRAVSLDLDWRATARLAVYCGYQYRRGDIVSTAAMVGNSGPNYSVADVAEVIELDDAYGGFAAGVLAYRLEADTQIATLGVNRSFSPSLSVDLQLQSARSNAGADIQYDRLVGFASLLKRF